MAKSLESIINESLNRIDYWKSVLGDDEALADLAKTDHDVQSLVSYFEGRLDAFIQARSLMSDTNER